MEELYVLLLGALVSGIVQIAKKVEKDINPLLIVGLFSVIVGMVYVILLNTGVMKEELLLSVKNIFSWAVVIFAILKQFVSKKEEKEEVFKGD